MATATERGAVLAVPAAAGLLLWPALWNGYPVVFADTGTYLSQAVHHYAGWDRPVFYSLFILPLHGTLTLWPVVGAQALLAAWVLWLSWRALAGGAVRFVALAAALAALTWLPWIVSEIMPDLFTPLLVLAAGLLAWLPHRLSGRERWMLMALMTLCIATQQSSVPLALGLAAFCAIAAAWRDRRARIPVPAPFHPALFHPAAGRGAPERFGSLEYNEAAFPAPAARTRRGGPFLLFIPPAAAVLALCAVNLAAHGRFAVSPYGNIFLLARVLGDGPGREALRHDCPATGWRLCAAAAMPTDSDVFLWDPGSPLYREGGPKAVSAEAGAIIAAALRADPGGEAKAALVNSWTQLARFASGDGLRPWRAQVSPWIARDFPPAENAAYLAARQQRGILAVPGPLAALHACVALAGVLGCVLLLCRRGLPPAHGAFLLTVLLSLPLGAAITGAFSGPHDRYQARLMWLPSLAATAVLAGRRTAAREAAPSGGTRQPGRGPPTPSPRRRPSGSPPPCPGA